MIHLERVSKIYAGDGAGPVFAVRELSFSIRKGEFVVITGRSGSGKTTALNLIAGLTRPTSGRVELDGVDFGSLSDEQQAGFRNLHIGFIFQFPSLLPSLTVLENIALPATFGGKKEREVWARASELLRSVGLEEKATAFPRQLSAGQQQRAVIARSLINEPKILIADEPTSNLDDETERDIISAIEAVYRNNGITVLLVTHGSYPGTAATGRLEFSGGRVSGGLTNKQNGAYDASIQRKEW